MPPGLLAEVEQAIRRRRLLVDGDAVLVAVSGGPDSVALLAALAELGRGRWRLSVAHVRHGLRGAESEEDARFVARLAADLGLPFEDLDGRIHGGSGLEERARRRRYEVLLAAAARGRHRRIAVGHTRDDQAETLLHRLVRGSGRHGLAAMRWARADGVVRPLLGISRERVLAYLDERALAWREDRSNGDPRHTRNRIRHVVLPVLERELEPRAREALARAAEILGEEDAWIEAEACARLATVTCGEGLEAERLAALPPPLARRVVRLWLEQRRGDILEIGLDHVDRILDLASEGGSRALSVPGGLVRRRGNQLRWGAPTRSGVGEGPVPLVIGHTATFGDYRLTIARSRGRSPRADRWQAVFDLDQIDLAGLRARAGKPGDRLRPLGLGGTKKIQDLFVDAKVPREERARHPVVACGEAILWLPGIARDESAAIGPLTRNFLVVRCVRASGEETHRVAAPDPLCYGPTGEKSPRGVRSGRSRLESAPTKEAD